jgi:hypothetical protein
MQSQNLLPITPSCPIITNLLNSSSVNRFEYLSKYEEILGWFANLEPVFGSEVALLSIELISSVLERRPDICENLMVWRHDLWCAAALLICGKVGTHIHFTPRISFQASKPYFMAMGEFLFLIFSVFHLQISTSRWTQSLTEFAETLPTKYSASALFKAEWELLVSINFHLRVESPWPTVWLCIAKLG